MSKIFVASGPARTNVPGQWRLDLNEAPSTAWRDRLVELASADPLALAFHIEIEGATLLFTSGSQRRGAQQAGLTAIGQRKCK